MRFVGLLNASNSFHGMRKEIDNIVLVRRSSEYARHECPESARPPLKTGGKMETVSISK
jgi:hypothetical protein